MVLFSYHDLNNNQTMAISYCASLWVILALKKQHEIIDCVNFKHTHTSACAHTLALLGRKTGILHRGQVEDGPAKGLGNHNGHCSSLNK